MRAMLPLTCGSPSAVVPQDRDWDLLLTAETHNFPCAVAPYPGMPITQLLSAVRSAQFNSSHDMMCLGCSP